MGSIIPAKPPVVSIASARTLDGYSLPRAIAFGLPASVAVALTLRWVSPEYETTPSGQKFLTVDLGKGPSPEDLRRALDITHETMKPGGPADCLTATSRLRAVARQRPTIEADEKLSLAVYAEKLAVYPVDAVATASERCLETSAWWPSVPELLAACERAMQPRRALAMALRLELLRQAPETYRPREPI